MGPYIHVAGTTALDAEGNLVGAGDLYAQTIQILKNVEAALARAGARMADVVRTRVFTTDIGRSQEIGRAHGEFSPRHPPGRHHGGDQPPDLARHAGRDRGGRDPSGIDRMTYWSLCSSTNS